MAAGKKANKKSAPKAAGSKTTKRRRGKRSFKSYIAKVNKNAKRTSTLSSKTVKILNSLCVDMLDKIATQAAVFARHNKRQTIRASECQAAVKVLFPADLSKHASSEASKACTAAMK